jgi:ribosomal protein S18 acetylase RimI-like enzyme
LAWLELHRHLPRRLRHVAVLTLAVAASARRRGLGRALLWASYGWASEVGVEKVALHVRASNCAAITLYESEGFILEGCERSQIRTLQGYEDNLIMAKFLPPGGGNRA